jgi:hypothetical protein
MYTFNIIYNRNAVKPKKSFRTTIKVSKNLHNLSLVEQQYIMWEQVSMYCIDYGWKKELFELENK